MYNWIKKHMVLNFTLRFLIQQYQPLVMFSIINLNKLGDILILYTASTGLSFFVISVTHLAIPLLAWVIFIHDKADTLNSEGF